MSIRPLTQRVPRVLYSGLKRLEREAAHSFAPSAEYKNEWNNTSTRPIEYVSLACTRQLYLSCLIIKRLFPSVCVQVLRIREWIHREVGGIKFPRLFKKGGSGQLAAVPSSVVLEDD
jgi:hypothetical protein